MIVTMRLQRLRKLLKDTVGQDLIEYALMAGFVAVAAGAVMPSVASSISTIFSEISSVMSVGVAELTAAGMIDGHSDGGWKTVVGTWACSQRMAVYIS